MFYSIQEGVLTQLDTTKRVNNLEQQFLGIISFEEIFLSADGLGLKNTTQVFSNKIPRFESHLGYDLMCFNILDENDFIKEPVPFYIYLKDNLLLFICEDTSLITEYMDRIINEELQELTYGRVLAIFLDKLTERDFSFIDKMEDEIFILEDLIVISKNKNHVKDIMHLRKKLLRLKQHYERLTDFFEMMLQNENQILDRHALKTIKIIDGRINRMHGNILNLTESVTHLREAYQSEVDIQLNHTMKVITVVTSVFLPLSIITGWYGMNLKMPEYGLSFGYPLIIGVSLLIVAISVFLFKKNKWF
ncbi:MAG TPA: CorA family divalent cation transporter [Oscillospiraceae bacterium]|nr:CorA family divalent cation transporter [Oscillospiraceae bacterium]